MNSILIRRKNQNTEKEHRDDEGNPRDAKLASKLSEDRQEAKNRYTFMP